MKKISCIVLLFVIMSLIGCQGENEPSNVSNDQGETIIENEPLTIAVSILPQEEFVKAVVGEDVNLITMIPPGYSPESFEPTPKQLTALSEADVYFAIGIQSEDRIIEQVKSLRPELRIVHLDESVSEQYDDLMFDEDHEDEDHDEDHEDEDHEDEDHDHEAEEDGDAHEEGHAHTHTGRDPHIWLSPKRVEVMVEAIEATLSEMVPELGSTYAKNAEEYLEALKALDSYGHEVLETSAEGAFIIYHPALGYFAEDYGLEMIAMEEDGKEATAQHLEEVFQFAKEKDIKVVFYQQEFDKAQPTTLAERLGGIAVELDVLAPNYIENMTQIIDTFAEHL